MGHRLDYRNPHRGHLLQIAHIQELLSKFWVQCEVDEEIQAGIDTRSIDRRLSYHVGYLKGIYRGRGEKTNRDPGFEEGNGIGKGDEDGRDQGDD